MNKWKMTAMCFVIALANTSAIASEAPVAWLTEGQGLPVCEAYLQEVIRRGFRVTPDCIGDREFHDKRLIRHSGPFEFGTKEEEHESMEALKSGLYFAHIYPFIVRYDQKPARYFPTPELRSWKGTPKQLALARQQRLSFTEMGPGSWPVNGRIITRADIDNDGTKDRLFFLQRCSGFGITSDLEGGRTMMAPVILKPDKDQVDVARTLRVLRTPIRRKSERVWRELRDFRGLPLVDRPTAEMASDSAFGLFTFSGQTYVDFTWAIDGQRAGTPSLPPAPSEDNVIRVFRTDKAVTSRQCSIKLVGRNY
jgi:hypothetical protein